jgi:hypothetical protein
MKPRSGYEETAEEANIALADCARMAYYLTR